MSDDIHRPVRDCIDAGCDIVGFILNAVRGGIFAAAMAAAVHRVNGELRCQGGKDGLPN